MNPDRFILNSANEPVVCDDLLKWARWMEITDRHVKDERIGESRVSTVFLGLDHQYGDGPPLLFETMVFGGPLTKTMERCSTWEQAKLQHEEIVNKIKTYDSTTNPA